MEETQQIESDSSALKASTGITLCNGKYELMKFLGKGGFGITYLGRHILLNKYVAIKEYFPKDNFRRESNGTQVSYSDKSVARRNIEKFLKEAKTMAELNHEGVVKVNDVFEENNTAYYVMEYIEGKSLAEQLPIAQEQALAYIKQAAEALQYVHTKGILHLDIKPANIMINQSGKAVLIDFGISKHYDSEGKGTSSSTQGYSSGYSPIEQMTPGGLKQFTPPTDIYALGATLYKIVSGTTPPVSTDLADEETLSRPENMSREVFGFVKKCMQQKRKDRPQTMSEVLGLIEALSGEKPKPKPKPDPDPIPEPDPEPKRKFKKITIINRVVTVIICVFCGIFGYLHYRQPDPIVYEGEIPTPEVETFNANGVEFKMIKVDGDTFRMGATSEQGSDAWNDEKPVHSVTLSDYYIGETEVTQELWQAVMGSNPSSFKGNNQRPVEQVSWDDCQEFIRKLNSLTGKKFRLPTEAEWEYAARGGKYCRGYKCSGSNNVDEVAWYWQNSGDKYLSGDWEKDKVKNNKCKAHSVKTKKANELGLYDMSGNVWEWCNDWYGDYQSYSQTNPTGHSEGEYRVLRGGSWNGLDGYVRVSIRINRTPDRRSSSFGLRLAL